MTEPTTREKFEAAIAAAPRDKSRVLIFADRLDEQGDAAAAPGCRIIGRGVEAARGCPAGTVLRAGSILPTARRLARSTAAGWPLG